MRINTKVDCGAAGAHMNDDEGSQIAEAGHTERRTNGERRFLVVLRKKIIRVKCDKRDGPSQWH